MHQVVRAVSVAALFWVVSIFGLSAQTEEDNGAYLAAAIAAAESGDWDGATALAGRISDWIGPEIITWMRLRTGQQPWQEYLDFLKRNPDWPGLRILHAKGEAAMPVRHTPSAVLTYFKETPPQTGIGVLRLTEAYLATGQAEAAKAEAVRAWRKFSMTKDERVQLLARFKDTLKPHHIARLDMLLWRGLGTQAEGLYSLVPAGHVKLAKARLGLQKMVRGIDALVTAVPTELQGDAGLVYERFRWRTRKGRYEDARNLLVERSVSAEQLGRPDKWADRRRVTARQEMRDGNNMRAYLIASQHFLTKGSAYADLEWLAGYIALRKLRNPKLALAHFNRFKAAVATPISYGRAGYWQGRAYDMLKDKAGAKTAYEFGAQYQTSFYGQLAAEKIGAAADKSLAGREDFPDWRTAGFMKSSVLHAAAMLHYADQPRLTEQFIRHLGESLGRTELQQLADMTMEIGRPSIAVRLSKQAARQGHVLPKTYYPVTDLAREKLAVDPELAMSIARRESELDQYIKSPAGAMGLMQVMPGTAKIVAKDLGVVYSRSKLTDDWKYNARIGSAYLAEQLDDFNGSYILAFAAYNAGPNRPRRWIERYGDPRKNSVDQIDWIEHIPFRETRNYVMRVMESVHVYRARIKGRTPKLRISKDLKKG